MVLFSLVFEAILCEGLCATSHFQAQEFSCTSMLPRKPIGSSLGHFPTAFPQPYRITPLHPEGSPAMATKEHGQHTSPPGIRTTITALCSSAALYLTLLRPLIASLPPLCLEAEEPHHGLLLYRAWGGPSITGNQPYLQRFLLPPQENVFRSFRWTPDLETDSSGLLNFFFSHGLPLSPRVHATKPSYCYKVFGYPTEDNRETVSNWSGTHGERLSRDSGVSHGRQRPAPGPTVPFQGGGGV